MKSRPSKEYMGVYESNIYGKIVIQEKNDELNMRFRHVDERLYPFQMDEFLTKEHSSYPVYPQLYPVYRIKFIRNGKGRIDRLETSVINDPKTRFLKRGK